MGGTVEYQEHESSAVKRGEGFRERGQALGHEMWRGWAPGAEGIEKQGARSSASGNWAGLEVSELRDQAHVFWAGSWVCHSVRIAVASVRGGVTKDG